MNSREKNFLNNYCLSVYTMQIARFSLEMAISFCAVASLKHKLRLSQNALNVRIREVVGLLKPDKQTMLQRDLNDDELQALGNILHHLLDLDSIEEMEDAIVHYIKLFKKPEDEKQLEEAPGEAKA